MNKIARRASIWLTGLLLLVALAAGSLLLSPVQSFLGRKAAELLSQHIPQQASIGRIDIRPSGRIFLSDIRVLDHRGDTLMAIDSVRARIKRSSLWTGRLAFRQADLYGPKVRVIKYPGEDRSSLALFLDHLKGEKKKPFYLDIARARLFSGEFSFRDDEKAQYEAVQNLSLGVSGLSIAPGDYRATLDSLQAQGRDGSRIRHLSGEFRFAPRGIIADGVKLLTEYSDLSFSASAYLPEKDSTGQTFGQRLRRGEFSLSVDPSHIDPRDVRPFYPRAEGIPPIELSAHIVAQKGLLDVKNLDLSVGDLLSTDLSGQIDAPTSLREGSGSIVLKNLRILPREALAVAKRAAGEKLSGKALDKLSSVAYLSGSGLLTLEKGNVTSVVSLTTRQHGRIFLRGQSTDLWNRRNARYTVRAVLENVNAGLLTGAESLGKTTLFADIRGRGFQPDNATVELRSSIPLLEFRQYPYSGISLQADLKGGVLAVETTINDPNLAAKISSRVERGAEKGSLHTSLDMYLDKSDLHALGLVQDSIVNLRGTIQAELTGSGPDDVLGTVDFSEMSYNNGNNYYYIDRIRIASEQIDSLSRRLSIESENLFNGYIQGNYLLTQVPAAVTNGLLSGFKAYRKKEVTPGQQYDFQFHITASNVKIVNTPLIFDGRTHFGGRVDTSGDDFSLEILADRINYRDILVDTLQVRLNTALANVLTLQADKFINPVYSIEGLDFSALRYADSLAIRSDFHKWNSADSISFHLNAYQKDDTQGNIIVGFLPSRIDLEHLGWRFGSQGIPGRDRVVWNVNSGEVRIDSLEMTSGEAMIGAGGFYTPRDSMDLRLEVRSLDLSRTVFLRNNVPLEGNLNGLLHLSRADAQATVIPEASLRIDSLAIGTSRIGNFDLSVVADLGKGYVSTSAHLIHGSREALALSGGLRIEERSLIPEIDISLDSLPVDAVHYLLPTVFNRSSGYASALLEMRGRLRQPDINGSIRLDGTRLGINFTNVEYSVPDGTMVPVRNSFFYFEKIPVRDVAYGTQGTLQGRIYHDRFKPWYLDLRADADRMLVLNTTGENEEKFYGRVFASGYLQLQGPTQALKYNIAGRTERNTTFAIDIGSTSDFKESQMITFVPPRSSHVDSLLLNLKKKIVKKTASSSSEMNIAIQATPQATLTLYLDKATGHMIQATGQGNLAMHLSPKGAFTLNGTYEATGGTYNFVYTIIKRPFNLLSGGKITFDGDPANPSLDLSASYKTTVKPAVFLSSVAENAREEVLTTIHLTGDLNNPVYNFDIQMPRATENVQEELAYRLSDQEQLNQQFISLMVLNSFTASGENENQNLVATGVSGLTANMLSSQFSNILQRFVRGVDINVNLNTATNRYVGTTESTDVEIGVSTKFFGDRMTVNGIVGVPTGTTQSDLVGDVEIEYNITPDGRLRAVFVNRHQNDYLNNQQGYLQSIGVSYRQEFNTFRELGALIKQSFSGKRSEQRRKARAERKAERTGERQPLPTPELLPAPAADTLDTVPETPAADSATAKISFR